MPWTGTCGGRGSGFREVRSGHPQIILIHIYIVSSSLSFANPGDLEVISHPHDNHLL